VGDIRVRGIERTSEPQVYLPAGQQGENQLFYVPKDLVLHASAPASSLLPAIREIVRRADPLLPVSDVRSLADVVDLETAPRKVQLRILGGFAATALLLAGIGIHGLLAFTVSRRAREIGVRMALGAMSGDILRMVLRRGLLLAAFGVIPGAALAYAAGRAMESLLAGVRPSDPATFAAAIGLSFAMTVAGSLLPALRAVRVDPMSVIRTE
jgi:ABC-type antimicrobial peptide transport system permease subunit